MFIADAFDPVGAIAIIQERGTLEGFPRTDLDSRIFFPQIIGTAQSPGRSLRQKKRRKSLIWMFFLLDDFLDGLPCADVVPNGVPKLLELIQDDVAFRILPFQFEIFVLDFLDIALRYGCPVFFCSDFFKPFESFFGHAFGEDSDTGAS